MRKLVSVLMICTLGVIVSSQIGTARDDKSAGRCPDSSSFCKDLGKTVQNVVCNTSCDYSRATGDYLICVDDSKICLTVTPYEQVTCSGACNNNPSISCSVTYNECH